MKKTIRLFGLSLLLGCLGGQAFAASIDIVPRGSALLDAFAALARTGALGDSHGPQEFVGETPHTRGELARLLEGVVQDETQNLQVAKTNAEAGRALRAALTALGPELTLDGVDMAPAEAIAEDAPERGVAVTGYVQPELRLRTGGDRQPGTGTLGVYRVTALGDLRSNLRFVLSASNWHQDGRRVFSNDIGAHDFSGLNEAYLELSGGRGLTVSLGRMYQHWGPGSRGATLLSDNAPALDQLQIAFPFSLGPHLGRNYRFTQIGATFQEGGERKYFIARRVELAVNSRLTADFQEAFKASRSRALAVAFFPDYYTGKNANLSHVIPGLKIQDLEDYYNAVLNAGLTYAADPRLRVYGQFAVDDLRTPGRNSGITPRKIAYLVGLAAQPGPETGVTAEYAFADPTTYTFHTLAAQWQKGRFDELALPSGPNTQEVFVRVDQKLTPQLSLGLAGRDRRRHDNSFPMPNARDLSATASYQLDTHSGVQMMLHDYRQDPFPIAPDVPVGNGNQPSNAEGNYGRRLRIRELDLAYQFFF